MESSRATAGTRAVMGSSNAVSAAQKEANNEAYTGLVANVASNASSKRDAVENRYLNTKGTLADKQSEVTNARFNANQSAIDTAVASVQGAANTYLASHTPNDHADKMNDMAEAKGVGNLLNQGATEQFKASANVAPQRTNTANEFEQANRARLGKLLFPKLS